MSEDTKPALTADEWVERDAGWPSDPEEGQTEGRVYLTGLNSGESVELCIDEWPDGRRAPYRSTRVPPGGRHKVAALALHQQPFGFTHDMVAALRHYVRLGTDPSYWSDPNPGVEAQARRAIGAMEALLPPDDIA